MFTFNEIQQIRNLLRSGKALEEVAATMGVTRFVLVSRLKDSGYRVSTWRDLEPIVPVVLDPDLEPVAAV